MPGIRGYTYKRSNGKADHLNASKSTPWIARSAGCSSIPILAGHFITKVASILHRDKFRSPYTAAPNGHRADHIKIVARSPQSRRCAGRNSYALVQGDIVRDNRDKLEGENWIGFADGRVFNRPAGRVSSSSNYADKPAASMKANLTGSPSPATRAKRRARLARLHPTFSTLSFFILSPLPKIAQDVLGQSVQLAALFEIAGVCGLPKRSILPFGNALSPLTASN